MSRLGCCCTVVLLLTSVTALAGDQIKVEPLVFEAEHVTTIQYPFSVAKADGASGDLALCVFEGAGSQEAYGAHVLPSVVYRFKLNKNQAEHLKRIYLRYKWRGPCSNSVFIQVNDKALQQVGSNDYYKWNWEAGPTVTFKAGMNEIRIALREDGVKLDKIVLKAHETPFSGSEYYKSETNVPDSERIIDNMAFIGGRNLGGDMLPSPDFQLEHQHTNTVPLNAYPVVKLSSASKTVLPIWIRNNAAVKTAGIISFEFPDGVQLDETEKQFLLQADEPLKKVLFQLSPMAGLPRGKWMGNVKIKFDFGKQVEHRLMLHRPWDWLVTKPYKLRSRAGINTPNKLDKVADKGIVQILQKGDWKRASADAVTSFGLLDMCKAVGDFNRKLAYAMTVLNAKSAGDYLLSIRHDDMVRVWVNGQKVFTSRDMQPSSNSRRFVKVPLRKGKNLLMIKLTQVQNYWETGVQVLNLKSELADVTGMGWGDDPDNWKEL